jgi:replicative DNA helicase
MEPARQPSHLRLADPTQDTLPYRQAPHNIPVEQALLGAILVNNEGLHRVAAYLLPEHFFEAAHGRIYAAMTRLVERGQLASPVTLAHFFERDEGLAEVGGAQYLARLAASVVSVLDVEDYGRTVYDLALRRQLIAVGEDMVNRAYEPTVEETAEEQVEAAEGALFKLVDSGSATGGLKAFATSLTEALHQAETAHKRDGQLTGTPTGMTDLDQKLGGLHKSDLIVLAGRPSMGKSSLASNIAFNAARAMAKEAEAGSKPKVIAFFSLEMSAEQLATRILSEQCNIPSEKIRRGLLTEDEFAQVVRKSQDLESLGFYIDDTAALSISAVRTRSRRLQRSQGLGLIVIDYLQLLRPSGRQRVDNRVQEISEITQGLKALAKDLDVPVLALSQLSRQVEAREDKRPQLSDLRESGTIEQDSDVVMFIFRKEYYLEREKPEEGATDFQAWQDEMNKVHNVAEIIIGKQRHGPTGTVRLRFEGATTRFSDLEQFDRGGPPF